jgi:hypothetical protein
MMDVYFVFNEVRTKVLYTIKTNNSSKGPGQLVGIATGYGLDGLGIESR